MLDTQVGLLVCRVIGAQVCGQGQSRPRESGN